MTSASPIYYGAFAPTGYARILKSDFKQRNVGIAEVKLAHGARRIQLFMRIDFLLQSSIAGQCPECAARNETTGGEFGCAAALQVRKGAREASLTATISMGDLLPMVDLFAVLVNHWS
jgi:hypothetical protein